jgi:hypothetical protein
MLVLVSAGIPSSCLDSRSAFTSSTSRIPQSTDSQLPHMSGYIYVQKGVLLLEEKVMSDRLPVPSPSQQVSVLVVDDADVIRKTLRNFLKRSLL